MKFSQALRINTAPTVHSSSSLSTTPVKVTLATTGHGAMTYVKILNLHATQLVAFTVVAKGAAAPTVNATLADANCGAIIAPGKEIELQLASTQDLYVVASAASTSFAAFSVAN